ncbi:hypothetical protein [Actibacterium sp. 188UL27-1]|uniref:hypothetical protein n=1 Tax=Actibacterium sp. 188UL27-1 TaxID=2786961 RepID=UPI0019599878|nr:hypothetical protein [Actibacterium sp. 188UL27-1]MBM7066391.1 hypothetical protein [Actibacterium sp. 188UL27-1]
MRIAADIRVLCGVFETQQMVFEHLLHCQLREGAALDMDHISVICRADPRPRLSHHFEDDLVEKIEEELGLRTTVVLILPGAVAQGDRPLGGTEQLSDLGFWRGHVHVPG